jgi:phosphatidylinositol-3-phosphatase
VAEECDDLGQVDGVTGVRGIARGGPPRARWTAGRAALLAVAAVLALGLGAACARRSPDSPEGAAAASASARPRVPSVPGAIPRPDHVLVVVFENKSYEQVVGAAQAPYLTSLARAGANFTDAHGETHPSQPNYIALLSGDTHGVTSDSCPRNLGDQPNLARQLLDAGRGFVGYSEDLPQVGFTGCGFGRGYARKHNPWVDFANVPPRASQPLSALPADFAALPAVAMVIPNLCNDMHDCPVATGDDWARQHLAGYLDWARTHNSLLIVTFDEDSGTAANRIPTVFVGPMVRPGDVGGRVDHYSILRTIEDMYQLAPLGGAASTAPIGGIWTPAK